MSERVALELALEQVSALLVGSKSRSTVRHQGHVPMATPSGFRAWSPS
jgi:hypothetical protein